MIGIIEDWWNCQLHRPFHVVGYLLNPSLYYDTPRIEFNYDIMNGMYDVIGRLVKDTISQHKIIEELNISKNAHGMFGSKFAKEQIKTIATGERN